MVNNLMIIQNTRPAPTKHSCVMLCYTKKTNGDIPPPIGFKHLVFGKACMFFEDQLVNRSDTQEATRPTQ